MATTVLAANTYSSHVEDEEPIVLSDLVRTAEASRLRRRGAITAAHRARGQLPSTSYVPSDPWLASPDYRRNRQPTSSQPVIPTQLDSGMPQAYPAWTEVIDPAKVEEESDGGHGAGFELYCGFEETVDDDDVSPYQPSPLPLPMHSSATSKPARSPLKFRQSTGCGALIHTNGSPRTKSGAWNAKGKASDVVVPMDKMYFERGGEAKTFACGCRWQGVGCSVCGNPLGNIYMPCQAATLTPNAPQEQEQSRSLRGARASTSTEQNQHHVYTFFCTAVTPSPTFEFPAACYARAHESSETSTTASANMPGALPSYVGWEGMAGMPTGEASEYTYGYADEQDEAGAGGAGEYVYDADGVQVQVAAEPGSPDKPSVELMFLPAR